MASIEAMLKAVSQKYISMHIIDIIADTYEAIKSTKNIDALVQSANGAQQAIQTVMDKLAQVKTRNIIKEFTTFSTLDERLRDNQIIRCTFLTRDNGWCEASFIQCDDDCQDSVRTVIFLVEDINEQVRREHIMREQVRKAEEQALRTEAQAIRDPLTGLLNQAGIERSINDFIKMCPEASCVLMTLDIDNFKLINDVFGHCVGDNVLKTVSDILNKKCPKPCFLSRNGGDEFMVFFTNTTLEEVRPFFKSFVKQKNIFMHDDEAHEFSLSMGAAEYPFHSKDYGKLREMADTALYDVKLNHKDGFKFYHDGMEKRNREQLGFNTDDFIQGLPGAFIAYKVDTDGHIIFANDDAIRLFGCDSMQDLMTVSEGKFINMIHPEDLKHVLRSVYEQYRIIRKNKAAAERTNGFVKFRIVNKQGQEINVECSGRRVCNKLHGEIVYVFIQESRLKEQYLKLAEGI
ncbi:hypothetical protein D081_1461 [Anaerovibrio sp. JC8]|uniref:diguanylate cyclase n=1 Tax=Anaerovibrio sp. JC8 TaxID=1240085 RepID=UPI000A0D4BA5|nr:diguanylate cyclase [Anaerovibrio sp. JC8]ORT99880.1 hypothetical protein D081_1461 [Anaerovibrio sp. JC8]